MKALMITLFVSIAFCGVVYSQAENCLNFDGIDDEIELDTTLFSTTDGNQAYTIEAWVKTLNGDDDCIVCQYVDPGLLRFQFEIREGQLNWWKGIGIGATETIDIRSSQTITDDQWHHVAATRSSQGVVILYIDGQEVGAGFDDNAFVEYNTSIGARTSSSTGYYNGNLDEIRIWNVERSMSEIQSNMFSQLEGNEPGLLAYYQFNQGIAGGNNTDTTTLIDGTINDLNGNLNNFALIGNTSNWIGSTVPIIVGLENIEAEIFNQTLQVYPNPTLGKVIVQMENLPQRSFKIVVNDILGKMIWESSSLKYGKGSMWKEELELKESGIYFLSVLIENQAISKRVIIVN